MTTREILVNSCNDCPFHISNCVLQVDNYKDTFENCPLKIRNVTISLKNKELMIKTCDMCDNKAVWIRYTQFSGDHHFCLDHAKLEKDFKKSDPSYFFWKKL